MNQARRFHISTHAYTGGRRHVYLARTDIFDEGRLPAPASFNINGTQYVVAWFGDGVTYVLPTGAVTPNTPAGQIAQGLTNLASNFSISIGGMPATVLYSGLARQYIGLYQFDVVVPQVPAGNAPLTFTLGGKSGAQTLYLNVQ
jgi:uncharacterized protein (TIGR03437 family)